MIIDILVAVGFRGGVEEVLNTTAKYLQVQGNKIRIIQMIWQGAGWADPELDFSYLCDATKSEWDGQGETLVKLYSEHIQKMDAPDLILVAGWPILVKMARKAVQTLGLDTKIISWLHGELNAYKNGGFGGIEELAYADAHLAINDKIAETIIKEFGDEAVVYRIINPINKKKIVFSNDRDTKILGFVGRFEPEKNLPFLLKCLSQLKDGWTLKVLGDGNPDGSTMAAARKLCEEWGIAEKVTFYGWRDDPWDCLRDISFLVIPSINEGSPLVASEALLCGIPVISTPTEGMVGKIEPGVNGFLIPFNDVDFFCRLIELLDSGTMPKIDPNVCRQRVEYLLSDYVLEDFIYKINAIYKCDSIPERYFQGNKKLYLDR